MRILTATNLLLWSLSLVACGGGGGDNSSDDSDVIKNISDEFRASVSGTTEGLNGSLVLTINSTEKTITDNGSFKFEDVLNNGEEYSLFLSNDAENLICLLSGDTHGLVSDQDINDLSIECIPVEENQSKVSVAVPINLMERQLSLSSLTESVEVTGTRFVVETQGQTGLLTLNDENDDPIYFTLASD